MTEINLNTRKTVSQMHTWVWFWFVNVCYKQRAQDCAFMCTRSLVSTSAFSWKINKNECGTFKWLNRWKILKHENIEMCIWQRGKKCDDAQISWRFIMDSYNGIQVVTYPHFCKFEKNPYEKEMNQIHPTHYQCAINSLFDNLVKCLGLKH